MHQRKSPRARRYDYSFPGGYFITICTKDRKNYFGNIKNGQIVLTEIGKICEKEIQRISNVRENVEIHEFVVMPNHIHMLIIINEYVPCPNGVDGSKNRPNDVDGSKNEYKGPVLGSIIKLFKGNISKYAKSNNILFLRQSRYHDHIIRNEYEYENIKYYIQQNPQKWIEDCFYC